MQDASQPVDSLPRWVRRRPIRSRALDQNEPPGDEALRLIDPATMVGVEIGALADPRLPGHPNVRYVDHADREELAEKYRGNLHVDRKVDRLVDVDHVWRPGLRLREVLVDIVPIDFVIAAHVIEHIPNPIDWLQQIVEVVRPGGVLSLVVPDMRFSFDAPRQLTSPAQILDSYLREIHRPSPQHVYDHESTCLGDVDPAAAWRRLVDPASMRRSDVDDPDHFAWQRTLASVHEPDYIDVHCSTFTPASFVSLMRVLANLELVDWEVAHVQPTARGRNEFFVSLRSVAELPAEARRARQLRAITDLGAFDAEWTQLWVSRGERRWLSGKRAIALAPRRAARRMLRRP